MEKSITFYFQQIFIADRLRFWITLKIEHVFHHFGNIKTITIEDTTRDIIGNSNIVSWHRKNLQKGS